MSIKPVVAQVALTHGPENVKPQVKLTDGSGNFCFEVCKPEAQLCSALKLFTVYCNFVPILT